MAAPFFRMQSAARAALPRHPGTRIQYIRGQGYRLVPVAATSTTTTTSSSSSMPSYAAPDRGKIWGEANEQAEDIYQPLLDLIAQRQERERSEAIARQQASVQAATQAYSAARQPLEDVYNRAIGASSAVETSIADRLKGLGGERAQDFSARLTQMGAPETGALAELEKTYSGATGANYAYGMADVGRLISRKAEGVAALQRGPLDYRRQSESELSESLNELSKTYGGQREELMANIPQQVSDLFERLYGQRVDESKAIYESRWQRIEWMNTLKKQAQEAQIVAREMGNKQAELEAKAREKELDRQLRWDIASMNEGGRNARDNPAPVASGPNMQYNPDGTPNPNYKPKNTGGLTPQQWRLRENEANKQINNILFARDKGGRQTQQTSQYVTNATNAEVNRRINAILDQNGILPNSARGIKLRKAAWGRLGIKTGPNGNPVVGTRNKPGVGG